MKVFVTGAGGFIGRRLVERILAEGEQVVALVRRAGRPLPSAVHIVEGDITRGDSFRSALKGCERLYHLAARITFDPRERESVFNVNATGTGTVLREAALAGIGRVVVVSSACTLGLSESADVLLNEDSSASAALEAGNPYLASKVAAERIAFRAAEDLDIVIVNPTTAYGAGDWSLNSGTLVAQVARSPVVPIPPGGSNVVDVDDVASGILAAGARGQRGKRYVLGGQNLPFHSLFDTVADVVGHRPLFIRIPGWTREPLARAASIAGAVTGNRFLSAQMIRDLFTFKFFSSERARKELLWEPARSFRQSLEAAWDFYRREGLISGRGRRPA